VRAYNGGLGAEPPAGFRGRAPGQGSGAKPPEAENLLKYWTFKVFYKLIISRRVDSVNIWLKWQDRFSLKWFITISLADN